MIFSQRESRWIRGRVASRYALVGTGEVGYLRFRPVATKGAFLDQLYERFNREEFHFSDPVEFVHLFGDPLDQEAVGLFAALMAYGGVSQIKASVRTILDLMRESSGTPSAWVRSLGDPEFVKAQRHAFRRFRHRLYVGADIVRLGELLSESWRRYGFLGAHFASRSGGERNLATALDGVMADWKDWSRAGRSGRPGAYFFHLLSSPDGGSACKRWCMYLRWMIRKDRVDVGIWSESGVLERAFTGFKGFAPSSLFMPLDTHSGRISRYLGLTNRKTLNWKAVEEVTEALRAFDSADPVRYDFALSRLGILDLCQRKFSAEICRRCDLVTQCRFSGEARA